MRGHITERGKGNWYAVFDLDRDSDTGKRKQKWQKLEAKAKKKAQDELTRIINDLNTGGYVEPTNMKVGEYLAKWLADYAKVNVAAKTYERYEEIVRLHLIPQIGHHKLSKLQPLHIQEAYAIALQNGRKDGKPGGLSARTVLHHHRVLREALQQAVKWQLIPRNPGDAVVPPRAVRVEMKVLTSDQAADLIEAARGSCLYMPILLALTTGMRRGEILGLRWQEVDMDAGTISVSRSLEQTKKGLSFKEPKTARSRRSVVLPGVAVDALRKHKLEQLERRLQFGPGYQDNGLVCALDHGAPVAYRLAADWPGLLEKAALPHVRFHDLRHTHATLLLGQGVHAKIVSERLGHSSIGITLDTYSHVLPSMQQDAAHKLDQLFRAAGTSR